MARAPVALGIAAWAGGTAAISHPSPSIWLSDPESLWSSGIFLPELVFNRCPCFVVDGMKNQQRKANQLSFLYTESVERTFLLH